jgi:hypothetical protein
MIRAAPVAGWEGFYEVTDAGEVYSVARAISRRNGTIYHVKRKVLRLLSHPGGYLKVFLTDTTAGRVEQRLVHRLVAEAFIPNAQGKRAVNHLDGDKTNNAATNLEWVTDTENQQHALRTGLRSARPGPRGAASPRAKLSQEQVDEIRLRLARGEAVAAIARVYHMGWSAIDNIRSGATWRT